MALITYNAIVKYKNGKQETYRIQIDSLYPEDKFRGKNRKEVIRIIKNRLGKDNIESITVAETEILTNKMIREGRPSQKIRVGGQEFVV